MVDRAAGPGLRERLIERFGAPQPDGGGGELFRTASGDTTRTLTYRPDIGAVAAILTEVAGRLASRTEYVFEPLGSGVLARTQVRTLYRTPSRRGPGRLVSTTVSWSDVRLVR
ncbi:MAG TPA: hypothetical protein VF981_04085 [Gemmatimonadaceae bacterium]